MASGEGSLQGTRAQARPPAMQREPCAQALQLLLQVQVQRSNFGKGSTIPLPNASGQRPTATRLTIDFAPNHICRGNQTKAARVTDDLPTQLRTVQHSAPKVLVDKGDTPGIPEKWFPHKIAAE